MFVIVEGPKCSGKSTLCVELQSKFGGTVIHFPTNGPKGKQAMIMLNNIKTPDDCKACQDMMEEDIDDTLASLDPNKLWILDRSFISNAVYRTGNIVLKDKYSHILENCMLVIMLATDETLQNWIAKRVHKPLTDYEQQCLSQSNERFHSLAKNLGCELISKADVTKELKIGKFYREKK